MHPIQIKLLEISQTQDLSKLTLRKIGELIGESHPQKIKHHLNQLNKKRLIDNQTNDGFEQLKESLSQNNEFINIPILGSANCGKPTIFADEMILGFLKVSQNIISKKKNLFALKASGNSMNNCSLNHKSIEDGDYVIIDGDKRNPKDGNYVLSIIEGAANIKRFVYDKLHKQIMLLSESDHDYPPIIIHEDDFTNFLINGEVVDVIKMNYKK